MERRVRDELEMDTSLIRGVSLSKKVFIREMFISERRSEQGISLIRDASGKDSRGSKGLNFE